MADPVVIAAHGRHAQAVAFTRSGRILISAGQDAHIRLWSVPGFRSVGQIIGHRNSVNSLAFSPDEKLLATSSSDGTVRIWSFPDGRCDRVLQRQVAARFSHSGRWLATLSTKAQVSVYSMPDGERVFQSEPVDRRAFALEFAPDESFVLAGGNGAIHRLAMPTGALEASWPAHDGPVASLRLSPDHQMLLSTGVPGVARFWSTKDWSVLGDVNLESPGVYASAFSPDSAEACVSVDFHIVGINAATRTITSKRRVGVKGIYGLAYSPDGAWLANACADGKVRVWALK